VTVLVARSAFVTVRGLVRRLAFAIAFAACGGGGNVATPDVSNRGVYAIDPWRQRADALCGMLGAEIDRGPTLFEPLSATIGEPYRESAGYSSHSDQRQWFVTAPKRWRRVGLVAAAAPVPPFPNGTVWGANTHVTAAWIEVETTPREVCDGIGLALVRDGCLDEQPAHVVVARPWNGVTQLACGIRNTR
jgi:hypothetical protein